MYEEYHLFPFDKVPPRSRVVIYGAGIVGSEYHRQITALDYCDILFFVDRMHGMGKRFHFREDLLPPRAVAEADFDRVIVAAHSERHRKDIHDSLVGMKVDPARIVHGGAEIPKTDILGNTGSWWGGGISYSQCGEDVMVYTVFQILGIWSPSYIDIGAHHPDNINNTALLYRNGGRGINIDANPALIGEFRVRRPDDVNLCVGVGVEEGELPFYMIDDMSALNTFDREWMEKFVAAHGDFSMAKAIRVPVKTLNGVIAEYAGGKWPQYLTIDIEGLDYDVLRQSDMTDGPLVVTVEAQNRPEVIRRMSEMMRDKGYLPYCRTLANLNYVRKDVHDKLLCVETEA